QFSDLPIIFLTARAQEIDRVVGLEIGADDYVTKPFSPREVSARVKVILKRMLRQKDINGSPENISTLQLTSSGCDYQYQQHSLGLTSLEFKLLAHLVSHPDNVFSRDQLLTACGQANDAGYERNIDSHIKSIRHKARLCHPDLDIIKTHRGFGYSHPSKVIS
ncbi:MAG: winged helix-turn-helix domain-containing protein, partial [Psychrobium sp.]|nr:winged helix-turn-helix domain-containing protein [Psychrobium sp.]